MLHCTTAAAISYPFEFRLVDVTQEHVTVSTLGFDDGSLSAASLVADWGNTWTRGGDADRYQAIRLER